VLRDVKDRAGGIKPAENPRRIDGNPLLFSTGISPMRCQLQRKMRLSATHAASVSIVGSRHEGLASPEPMKIGAS
jgi:hypothetical protein